MTDLVRLLQALSGAAWLFPLAMLSPALWRVLRGHAGRLDIIRAPWFFAAFVMVLGAARWLLYPADFSTMGLDELAFWAIIYIVSIGAAAGAACSLVLSDRP